MSQGHEKLLSADDDNFHASPEPWFTEGSWWSFSIPERRISGWVYHLTRLNLQMASGGVFIWDGEAQSCFEAPYFLNHSLQPLAPGPHDLNDFTWPDGTHLQTLEPLGKYRLRYADRNQVTLDLVYEGITEPYATAMGEPLRVIRFEQPCRVTGTLQLHGESMKVDCVALRDHSWGVRGEHTLATAPLAETEVAGAAERPVIYLYGAQRDGTGFFDMAGHGFLCRDGQRIDLANRTQTIRRHPETGYIEHITIEGADQSGRTFTASGAPLNLIVRPSNSGIGMIYLMEWDFEGSKATGDLQDVWPVDLWSRWRRRANGQD